MSKPMKKKRATLIDNEAVRNTPTVAMRSQVKNGTEYISYEVTFYIGGKRYRRQFKTRDDAESFQSQKSLELKGLATEKKAQMTSLSTAQINEVEEAYKLLGDTYTMSQAISFFLANHRAPDHEALLSESIASYLDDCERSGTRERTIKGKKSVLSQFAQELDNPLTHQVTPAKAQAFLRSLRAKDGISNATRKTWNNYRNELNHYFKWATKKDLATNRPHTFINPVEGIETFTAKQVAEQRKAIAITPPHKLQRRLTALMSWKDGDLVKYFALAYFAGIRPDGELSKLAKRESELINLKTRTIHIPASISKTKEERQVNICDNLLAWLKAYSNKPILPKNHSRLIKRARQAFKLSHDETRHSFISYHVALHRSVGDVALLAGNSESMVKKHYLNLRPSEEGTQFFAIIPDMKAGKSIFQQVEETEQIEKFKVV